MNSLNKTSTLLLIIFWFCQQLNAQPVKIFLDSRGVPVEKERASTYYFHEDRRTGNGHTPDSTLTYYYVSNNKIEEVQTVDADGNPDGPYVIYHENGNTAETGSFRNGELRGAITLWYESGKPRELLFYKEKISDGGPEIIQYVDSLGKPVILDGYGFWRGAATTSFDPQTSEEGKIVRGYRDSLWRIFRRDTLIATEQYDHGRLIKGVRYEGKKKIQYKEIMRTPKYGWGRYTVRSYLDGSNHFLKLAIGKEWQIAVFVSFAVNPDGSISDVQADYGTRRDIASEAELMIRKMTGWRPAIYRGKKVKFIMRIRVV